jgi:hypothetical protein
VSDDVLETDLRELLPFLQKYTSARDTMLVYRNTPSGHPYCANNTLPLQYPLPYNWDSYETPFMRNWGRFDHQNDIIGDGMRQIKALVLDAYTPTILRPDRHAEPNRDCLHYLIPGPADTWMYLLYNIMRQVDRVVETRHHDVG